METFQTTPFEDFILGSQFNPVLSNSKENLDITKIGVLQCCKCNSDFVNEQEALIHFKLHIIESHKTHFIAVTGDCSRTGCLFATQSKDALHFHCAHCQYAAREILGLPLHMEKAHLEIYKEVSLFLKGQTTQQNKVFQCGDCGQSIQGTVSILLHFFLHDSDKMSDTESHEEELVNGCNGVEQGCENDNSGELSVPNEEGDTCNDNDEVNNFEIPSGQVPSDATNRIVLTNPQLASLQTRVLLPILLNSMKDKNTNDSNTLNLLSSLIEADQKNEFPLIPPQHFLLSTSPEIHKEEQDDAYYNVSSPMQDGGDPSPEALLNGFRDSYPDYIEKSAGVFQCDQCQEAFKYQYLLAAHRKQVHLATTPKSISTIFPFQCHICGNEFTGLGDLKVHVGGHSMDYNSFCDVCGYAFTNLDQLADHMKTHSQSIDGKDQNKMINIERANRCECCSVKFPSKAELTRHIVKYQGTCNPNKIGIKCATCGLSVESLDALKQHRLSEHATAAATSSKRGFECDYCGKTFSCRSNLRDHLVVHTGEKPYPCDICGKTFSFVHNMKTHRLTHNEGRNEMCPYCDRAYKSKISLYYHMKKGNCRGLSTKEVPEGFFRCTECLQMFASEERFYQHKAKGHCQTSYRCEHCGVRCSTEVKLARHLNKGGCLQPDNLVTKKSNVHVRRSSREHRGRGRKRLDSSEEILCERCNYGHDCCCTFGCNYCGKRIFSFDAYNNHKRRTCPARRSKEKLKAIIEKRRLREQMDKNSPDDVKEDSNSGSLTDLSNFTANLLETVSSVQES